MDWKPGEISSGLGFREGFRSLPRACPVSSPSRTYRLVMREMPQATRLRRPRPRQAAGLVERRGQPLEALQGQNVRARNHLDYMARGGKKSEEAYARGQTIQPLTERRKWMFDTFRVRKPTKIDCVQLWMLRKSEYST